MCLSPAVHSETRLVIFQSLTTSSRYELGQDNDMAYTSSYIRSQATSPSTFAETMVLNDGPLCGIYCSSVIKKHSYPPNIRNLTSLPKRCPSQDKFQYGPFLKAHRP